MIEIPKKVFTQGETIHVKINLLNTNLDIIKGTLSLTGNEKAEFTIQSLLGKKGFHPVWSFFLPSRHIKESQDFLTQTHSLSHIPEGAREETIILEVPENAIPSYYGDNGKVIYLIELDLELENGDRKKEVEQILIDPNYERSSRSETIEVNGGHVIIEYINPLLIDSDNTVEVSTDNLLDIDTLRFVLIGREIVSASGITIENKICDLPLGQIHFDTNLKKIPVEFRIPSKLQHDYEGLISRLEYSIEINNVLVRKRIGISRKYLKKINEIKVNLEYPKTI
ncbi:MAG: hypothetical protein ACFFAU_02880 [Candidatus Hodarchaeota archaeon]